ncbi:hypothetical protein BDV96DRAFT_586914 [Lophiotrema nucula]|uniref:Transferase family-domain-containing protein n=1 Tax=Lophiotrema nucula TaxID=690887 RepID=A0A6A5YR94_9PLEO|nr:hypothetical protein BDV96DRAFT_586914 [Lophiotrema nucula]
MVEKTFVLSPFDQHGPRIYSRFALVFPVTDYDAAVSDLEQALLKTCNQLPFLKGKAFEKSEDRGQTYVTYSNEDPAPQFREIPAPDGFPSYKELQSNRAPFSLGVFGTPVPKADAGFEAPVLAASYTKIHGGGLVVCILTYHKVMDGGGYGEVLRAIAENTRGSALGIDPEDIPKRRGRLLGGMLQVPERVQGLEFDEILRRHPEYALKSRLAAAVHGGAAAGTPKPGTGINRVFAFSKLRIDFIKAKLADKLPARWLTVNNILTALIWASITHIRTTRAENPVSSATISKMDFSVSGRRLLGPTVSSEPYLGNCLGYALTEAAVDKLAFIPSESTVDRLEPVITSIASASDKLTADHMYEIIQLSDTNPDLTDLVPSWFFYGPADLHFTSMAGVGLYDLDFGPNLGKPQYVRSAMVKFDGVVMMLSRRRVPESEGDEAIEVSILLKEEDMERLAADEAWRSWLVQDA